MADQAGFLNFIRTYAQIPTAALPDNSPYITDAYNAAIDVVNDYIASVSSTMYDNAVYNYGTDYLLNWAPDQSGQTYFADVRSKNNLNLTGFAAGVIESASDEGTSESLHVPESFDNLMIGDLQLLKTPYGRAYLAIAQKFGPLWGLT